MAAENQLAHDERDPSIRQNLRRPRNGTVLPVFLHGAPWHAQDWRCQSKN